MREFEALVLHQGSTKTRRIRAADAASARRMLEVERFRVLSLKAKRGLAYWRHKFALSLFIQELIALLEAGLSLVEAIEALHDKATGDHQQVLKHLLDGLYQGRTLSQAMGSQTEVFPDLLLASVASSEHTGQLPQALRRFHHYEVRIEILRKRVKSTLLYPSVVMSVGALILAFLLAFVIPRFAVVFSSMKDLKGTARLLVWWGDLVTHHGPLLLVAVVAGIVFIVASLRTRAVRQRLWRAVWSVRRLREQHLLFVLARFYRTLGLLLHGGMPAIDALKLTGALLPEDRQGDLRRVLQQICEGLSLSGTLESNGLTTPVASRLLRVGERTGDLAGMCERIAQFHDEALERAIETFGKVFEPVLMLVVGGVIGLVVFLLYMPIFELAGSLSG